MKHLEDNLQMAVADYLRIACPNVLWWHTPNGGKRNAREAGRLKRMGVLPGVADIVLHWGNKKAAMELKVGQRTQTANQTTFMHQWIHHGGQYAVCRSLDEVQAALKIWGVI